MILWLKRRKRKFTFACVREIPELKVDGVGSVNDRDEEPIEDEEEEGGSEEDRKKGEGKKSRPLQPRQAVPGEQLSVGI